MWTVYQVASFNEPSHGWQPQVEVRDMLAGLDYLRERFLNSNMKFEPVSTPARNGWSVKVLDVSGGSEVIPYYFLIFPKEQS